MGESRVGLVIEDDHDIRELVRVVLTQAGFDVQAASSGADGVLAAKELDPAVITLDLGLPDIDGFEVARQIRQFSDAYIVMLTARAEELDTLIGLGIRRRRLPDQALPSPGTARTRRRHDAASAFDVGLLRRRGRRTCRCGRRRAGRYTPQRP